MERTESQVVSLPPDPENDKIKEFSAFGWNLHGRQEVLGHLQLAETPDNLDLAIFRGAIEGATGRRTLEYDHYVKLHFVRDLNFPNLAKIRELEKQYLFWYPFWPLWYFFGYKKQKAAAEDQLASVRRRVDEIMAEVSQYVGDAS